MSEPTKLTVEPCQRDHGNTFALYNGRGEIMLRTFGNTEADKEAADLCAQAPAMKSALQWLLDDMFAAGETHSPSGEMFDTVEAAAAALVNAGGSLPWYSSELAKAYTETHG